MEIGSFIEMQFSKGMEYYSGNKNIARLNSGRAAIWHAYRMTRCSSIWIPYYQCETVREFLNRKNVKIKYYHIDLHFHPIDLNPSKDEAVLIVNYYGIMSYDTIQTISCMYENVIIDNSQAFFSTPIKHSINVYSARKFIGVPDGAYVIGTDAEKYLAEYEQGFSSDTALFLLQRIEYGCEGKTYQTRTVNEQRIDTEDIMKMSKLTRTILDGTDYEYIKEKRRENFSYACRCFGAINMINPEEYYDDSCVPMVYPLVVEDEELLPKLLHAKHFQGHWWTWVLNSVGTNCFEKWISKYMIPITIDQRYGVEELDYLKEIIEK